MDREIISKVEISENGEMLLVLSSGGKPSYQYVYREAAEVHWDNDLKAFKAPVPRKWTYSAWFQHIAKIASGMGVSLVLSSKTRWVNVTPETKAEICQSERLPSEGEANTGDE